MTVGLHCSGPARPTHAASLPVRVPTAKGLLRASFRLPLAVRRCVSLRLASSPPVGSFQPTRSCPCWAHPAPSVSSRARQAGKNIASRQRVHGATARLQVRLPAATPTASQSATRCPHAVASFRKMAHSANPRNVEPRCSPSRIFTEASPLPTSAAQPNPHARFQERIRSYCMR